MKHDSNIKMMMSGLPPSESLASAAARCSHVGGVALMTIQNVSQRDECMYSPDEAENHGGVQVEGQRSFT